MSLLNFEINYPKLKDIEALRYKNVILKRRFWVSHWEPFYKKAETVKNWWGYYQPKKSKRMMRCFQYDGDGLYNDYFDELSPTHICALPIEELGLLVNAELTPEAFKALRGRCDGSIPQLTYDQALCDQYEYNTVRSSKYNDIKGECNDLIRRYISRYAYARYAKEMRFGCDFAITLTLNGREYMAYISTSLKDISIIKYPEDSIRTISEQDVINDETENPACHGYQFSKLIVGKKPRKT